MCSRDWKSVLIAVPDFSKLMLHVFAANLYKVDEVNNVADKMDDESLLRKMYEEFFTWYIKEQDNYPHSLKIDEKEAEEVIDFVRRQNNLIAFMELLCTLEFVWYRIYKEAAKKDERVLWLIKKYECWFLETYKPNNDHIKQYFNLPFDERIDVVKLQNLL